MKVEMEQLEWGFSGGGPAILRKGERKTKTVKMIEKATGKPIILCLFKYTHIYYIKSVCAYKFINTLQEVILLQKSTI